MYGYFAYIYVCLLCACLVPAVVRMSRSHRTGIMDGYKLLGAYWELNLGPPQNQALLTAEPFLPFLRFFFVVVVNYIYVQCLT